jgi:hypothetical protein
MPLVKSLYIDTASSSSFAPTIVAAPLDRKLTDSFPDLLLIAVIPRSPLVLTWYPDNSAFFAIPTRLIGEGNSSDGVTVYVLLPLSLPQSSSIISCCTIIFSSFLSFCVQHEGHSFCLKTCILSNESSFKSM